MCKGADGRKVFSDVPCGDDAKLVDVRPAAGAAAVNPSTSLRNEYYDIRGLTYADLRREIQGKGPEGKWWGSASTRLSFRMTTKRVGDLCAVDTVHAMADSTVRLPRWANRHEADRRVQEQWDSAFRSLDLHERGHVQISLDTARDLERSVREIEPAATCEALVAEARRRGNELNERERNRQVAYDRSTNHGVDQWSPYK